MCNNIEYLCFNAVCLFIQYVYRPIIMASRQFDYYDPSELHIYVMFFFFIPFYLQSVQ
jgi:hypothetical protein